MLYICVELFCPDLPQGGRLEYFAPLQILRHFFLNIFKYLDKPFKSYLSPIKYQRYKKKMISLSFEKYTIATT